MGQFTSIRMVLLTFIFLVGYVGLQGQSFVEGISVEEDLTLTLKEKLALEKFKEKMIPKMPHDYMKTDIYLIRWLRAKNLNQDKAEEMLLDNLKWRKDFKMDTINEEDWTDMIEEYGFTYSVNTVDKQDRPIGACNIGSWNVRRAVLTGKLPRAIRFGFKCMEELTQNVLKAQGAGKNVTQWKVLFNLEDFNIINGACPQCLQAYLTFITAHEERYPGFADRIVLINTPPAFQIVLNPLLAIISQRTSRTVKVFGVNRNEWQKYLDQEVSREQRTKEFGGTKAD